MPPDIIWEEVLTTSIFGRINTEVYKDSGIVLIIKYTSYKVRTNCVMKVFILKSAT